MSDDLRWFLGDLIKIVQQKYTECVPSSEDAKKPDGFESGERFAYYDVLDLINSQLHAFGHNPDQFGPIVPDLR